MGKIVTYGYNNQSDSLGWNEIDMPPRHTMMIQRDTEVSLRKLYELYHMGIMEHDEFCERVNLLAAQYYNGTSHYPHAKKFEDMKNNAIQSVDRLRRANEAQTRLEAIDDVL